MKRIVTTLALAVVFLLLALHSRPAAAQNHNVVVPLFDVQNRNVGTATLSDAAGGMTAEIVIRGMLPIGGDRALMVHAVSNCVLPNYAAGIGAQVAALPPVQFYSSGGADYRRTVSGVTLASLMDSDGSALVVHEDVPPNAKGIIICGEIPTGTGVSLPVAPPAAPPVAPTAPTAPTLVPPAPTMAPPLPTATAIPTTVPPQPGNCHPSYPDFCIPPPPPDLDCDSAIIGGRTNFRVLAPDPHRLDGNDNDGIGCES